MDTTDRGIYDRGTVVLLHPFLNDLGILAGEWECCNHGDELSGIDDRDPFHRLCIETQGPDLLGLMRADDLHIVVDPL